MRLYRVVPERYLELYSGLGGSYEHGGRWNEPGQPALYMALSAAGALLEMANYLPSPSKVPPGYRLGVYEIDDSVSVEHLASSELPADWWAFPYPRQTQAVGGRFLTERRALALILPSVCAPLELERIALINPLHPDIDSLHLIQSTDQLYNSRAFSGV